MASCIGILVNIVWVGVVATITMSLLDSIVGNRVAADDEIDGLDLAEMGAPGYADEPSPEPLGNSLPAPGTADLVRGPRPYAG